MSHHAGGFSFTRGKMSALGFAYAERDREMLLRDYRPAKTLRVQGLTHVRNGTQRAYFLRRGFISGPDEYAALLGRVRSEYGLPPYPDVGQVVPVLKNLGILLAAAHPHGPCHGADRARLDTLREECQLDGLECAHRSMPPELFPVFRAYCVEHGMFSTAGSDCHLDHEADTAFGRHGGEETWLDELLERLG